MADIKIWKIWNIYHNKSLQHLPAPQAQDESFCNNFVNNLVQKYILSVQFGEVGESEEELADSIEQGKAVIPDRLIFDHHHDMVEEFVNRFLHPAHLKEGGGIVPLIEESIDLPFCIDECLIEILLGRFGEEGRIDPLP